MGKLVKKEKVNIFWQTILLTIIIGIVLSVVFGLWGNSKEEYKYCSDSCLYVHNHCVTSTTIYDNSYNGYIPELDYEECFNELESCISDCTP